MTRTTERARHEKEIEQLQRELTEKSVALGEARREARCISQQLLDGIAVPGATAGIRARISDLETIVAHVNQQIAGHRAQIAELDRHAERDHALREIAKIAKSATALHRKLETARRGGAEAITRAATLIQSTHSELQSLRAEFLARAEELAPRFRFYGETLNNQNRSYTRASESEMQALVEGVRAHGADLTAVGIAWGQMNGTGDAHQPGLGAPYSDLDRYGSTPLADLGEVGRELDTRAGLNPKRINYVGDAP